MARSLYFLNALNQIAFVNATVETRSGSVYTVITRGGHATVVCPDGLALRGTDVHIVGGALYLRDNDNDRTILRTTPLVDIVVHEN